MSFAIRNLAMTFWFDWPFNMGDKLRKHTDKKYRHTCGHTSTFFLNFSYCISLAGNVLNILVKTEPKLAKNISL